MGIPDIGPETRVIDILREARDTADWDLVESVYRQCVHIVSDQDGSYLPDALPGRLAEVLSRVASSYIGDEERLAWHTLAVFADADPQPHELLSAREFRMLYQDARFHRFWNYSPEAAGRLAKRRRPCPFESVVESCRRLRDLNAIERALRPGPSPTAGILGGSLGYGRFYSVSGSATGEGSDLDLVVVVGQTDHIPDIAQRLATVPGARAQDVAKLRARAGNFLDGGLADGRTVFSHKLTMWGDDGADPLMKLAGVSGRYLVSLHLLTLPTLEYLLVRDSVKLGDMSGTVRSLRDFREMSIARKDHQRSFGGRNNLLDLSVRKVRGGFLRRSRVYFVDGEDHYYPGMFQNLISPRFDLRWEDLPVRAQLDVFRWKLVERLQYERRVRPHEYLRLSLSHTRSEVFAPHIAEAIDSSALTD